MTQDLSPISEQVVLSGHGHKLIGETAADSKIRAFIKATPTYLVSGFEKKIVHR